MSQRSELNWLVGFYRMYRKFSDSHTFAYVHWCYEKSIQEKEKTLQHRKNEYGDKRFQALNAIYTLD